MSYFFHFLKKKISINSAKFSTSCLYCMCKSIIPKYIETKSAGYLLLLHIKLFKKIKKRSGASLPPLFNGMFFEEKYYSRYILLTKQITLSDCLYFLRCCVYYNLFSVDGIINFEINFSFLTKLFPRKNKKVRKKLLNNLSTKRAFVKIFLTKVRVFPKNQNVFDLWLRLFLSPYLRASFPLDIFRRHIFREQYAPEWMERRIIFTTRSNFCDKNFLQKYEMAKNCFSKSFIINFGSVLNGWI